jgi:hypothetical protein
VTTRAPQHAAGRWLRSARREVKTKPASSDARGITSATSEHPTTAEVSGGARTNRLDVYELSRLLCVPVTIDDSGWLRDSIELLFVRKAYGLHPTEVKIGAEVSAADARQLGNAFELCERYNRAVLQLQLIGSAELMRQIADRQEEHMGYRRVRYFTLANEIRFLEKCLKEVAE